MVNLFRKFIAFVYGQPISLQRSPKIEKCESSFPYYHSSSLRSLLYPINSIQFYIQSIVCFLIKSPSFQLGEEVGRRGVNIQTPVLIHFTAHSESLLGFVPTSIYPQHRRSLATGIFSHISMMSSPALWETALSYHKSNCH